MNKILIAFLVLVLAMLACGQPAEEWELRGWTVTPSQFAPTQTPVVVIWTSTPNPTQTPNFVQITQTPSSNVLCVSADIAVYLRPSQSEQGYPILPLPNGTRVNLAGSKDGDWLYVEYKDKAGWVFGKYLSEC